MGKEKMQGEENILRLKWGRGRNREELAAGRLWNGSGLNSKNY
jgi:hypothetical protein